MAEIINLKRVKKAKARAEKSAETDANRVKHGTPKHLRELAKARDAKNARDLDLGKLDRDKDGA